MSLSVESKITAYSCATLAFIAIAFALFHMGPLLVPFVVAIILYYVLKPMVISFEEKLRFKRFIAISVTMILSLLFFGFALTAVSLMLREFIGGMDEYRNELISIMDSSRPFLEQYGLSFDFEGVKKQLSALPVFSIVKAVGGQLANIFSKSTIVFIYLLFLMLGSSYSRENIDMWSEINIKIRDYIITKFWLSLITGVIVGTFLHFYGLKFAFMFAVLTFMLNFIPTLGSIVATLLPLPVALLEMETKTDIMLILLIPGLVQFVIGSILEPKIIGKSFNIHPVVLLLSLIFWGMLWGIAGAFLAMPITVAIKVVLSQFALGEKVVPLFEGKLPLRPGAT